MCRYNDHSCWGIWLFFVLAFVLQIMPWPDKLMMLRPNWLALFLIYWVMAAPKQVNIGTGFILGIIWDVIVGSTLGIRGLALSLLSYFVAFECHRFRNMQLWKHGCMVVLLTAAMDIIISWGEFIIGNASFHPELFWSSFVNGMLWPWLFLLISKLRQRYLFNRQ
ncbi:rod shape-determining protein MreD [Candidatus Profftia tarda]|nr:rod shape-determining protein MreD [Candidatus Profftia tarda]